MASMNTPQEPLDSENDGPPRDNPKGVRRPREPDELRRPRQPREPLQILQPMHVTIGLVPEMHKGIAEQLRTLADLLDPPKDEVRAVEKK